jgi:hypothetical protein
MVLLALLKRRQAPAGLTPLFAIGTSAAVLLAALATARAASPLAGTRTWITGMEVLVVAAASGLVLAAGHAHGLSVTRLAGPVFARFRRAPKTGLETV